MSEYLADTSAWNRSRFVAERWETLIENDELRLCAPILLELLYSAPSRREYRHWAADFARFPFIGMTPHIERAARRTQTLLAERSQHRGPTPVDLMIAATAEVHGVTLLHYDRHFDAIARVTGQPCEWIARRGSLD